MNCPTCGLNLQGVTSSTCPRCGQPITPANPYGQPPAGYPSTPSGYNPSAPMGYQQPGGYGQPSGYGQPAGYGQPVGYGMPVPPPPPAKKPRLSRGLTRVLSLVIILACVGIVALVGSLSNKVSQTPLPGVTATVTGKLVYRQTFTSSIDAMTGDSHCTFANGGYQIQDGIICYANVSDQSNATITVQVKQSSGDPSSSYGIVFRRSSKGNYYFFQIDSSGDWVADKCVSDNCTHLAAPAQNQAIQSGMNAVNTLQVHMNGSHFDFFANGVSLGSADDSTFSKGKVGMGVESGTTCVFNNMEITNP